MSFWRRIARAISGGAIRGALLAGALTGIGVLYHGDGLGAALGASLFVAIIITFIAFVGGVVGASIATITQNIRKLF